MQSNTEHEEDDANLSELLRQTDISDEAGRVWSNEQACHEVAGEGRDPETVCDRAKYEGEHEAANQSRDQRRVVRHAVKPFQLS
jgi:hypothetical protein